MQNKINNCFVNYTKTLMDGFRAIENSQMGIALVIDNEEKLYGTLTDGDIRRRLLKGDTLNSPLKHAVLRNCVAVSPNRDRSSVLDLMKARNINQIPIVDSENTVVGIHLLHEIIGSSVRNNWAVVMAGGKGTRLRPITENLPKPMIKVAGKPILEHIILHLLSYGIRTIYIAINYLGEVIKDYFSDGHKFGCSISYLQEKEFLGTGGALSLLPEPPKDPIIVMNGDLITQVNIDQMINFHKKNDYVATLGVKPYYHQVPYGCIHSIDNEVVSIIEKPISEHIVNTGIYLLNPEVLELVDNRFFPITELFEECLKTKKPIGAFKINDDWIDIGQHGELKKARGDLL
jgi:dTDP-glucose pyrophosphorylase